VASWLLPLLSCSASLGEPFLYVSLEQRYIFYFFLPFFALPLLMLYATCCWLLVQNCYMQLLPVVQCNVLIALYEYWLSATSAMGSKNCSNNQQGMFVSHNLG